MSALQLAWLHDKQQKEFDGISRAYQGMRYEYYEIYVWPSENHLFIGHRLPRIMKGIGLGAEDWRHLKNILTMESHFIHLPSGHHRFCLYLSPSTSPCFPRQPNFQRNELKLAESKQESSTEQSFPALSHHRIPYHSECFPFCAFCFSKPVPRDPCVSSTHLCPLCLATRRGRDPWATNLANEKRGTGHASPFFRA